MLSFQKFGNRGPVLVLLHWLSGSAQTWAEVSRILAERGVQCICLDLPGFGDANSMSGYSVRATADAVTETIQALRAGAEDEPWFIGGHSMGGKIAAVVARAAVDGKPGLGNLHGAFLVSASPPSPEPMDESNRQKMSDQLGECASDLKEDRKRAEKFVDDNTGKMPLPEALRTMAVDDLLRMNRTALRAWFDGGSKEDWSSFVGVLPIPVRILAGSEEPELNPDKQREKTLPHFQSGDVITLKGGGHIGPLERPFEVAEYATSFLTERNIPLEANASKLGDAFASLLESPRVSPQTRAVMETRLHASSTWNHEPTVLSADAFRTMRALAECVVPRTGFDIAGSIEKQFASGAGDGWRFATLPVDLVAWQKGLASLDAAAEREFAVPFVALHNEQQRSMLKRATEGHLGKGLLGTIHLGDSADAYSAEEMKQWFEDVRSECAKCYMAHPATMERVGFTGFADESGFTRIQLGQQEELNDE